MDKIERFFLGIAIGMVIGGMLCLIIDAIVSCSGDRVHVYQDGANTEIAFKDYSIENYEVIIVDDNKTDIIVHMNKEAN